MTYRYRILLWDENFETATSRKLRRPYWVSVPNKQSGKGFIRIMVQEDGATIFGIWILIVEACSAQLPPRAGWLTDDGTAAGVPWTMEDLAERWRRPYAEVARALDVLCSPKVGWIEALETDGRISQDVGEINRCPVQSSPVQSSRGGASAAQTSPGASPGGDSKDERRRIVRTRLGRLRFASDDTALEEWFGLLELEARCRDLTECLECLNWLKLAAKREGVSSRYATAYEGLAMRWHQANHQKQNEAEA